MDEKVYLKYLQELIGIDSTLGDCAKIADYVESELVSLGYDCERNRRGDVIANLGADTRPVTVFAHLDDIGLMVRKIHPDGTLRVTNIGGLFPCYSVGDNVRVHTGDDRVYSGTLCRKPGSIHVGTPDFLEELPEFNKNICIVLDEDVDSAEATRALGVETGDFVALEPRFTIVNGYIKSRFLDDKACAAVLLTALYELKDKGIVPERRVHAFFCTHEEMGQGGTCINPDTEEVIALDIAPTGPDQNSNEHKVTIIAKGALPPLNRELTNELRNLAAEENINYTVDVFTPGYSTDAEAAFGAGYDVRHAAFGPGTSNSHGYERIHMDAIRETYKLLMAYLLKK